MRTLSPHVSRNCGVVLLALAVAGCNAPEDIDDPDEFADAETETDGLEEDDDEDVEESTTTGPTFDPGDGPELAAEEGDPEKISSLGTWSWARPATTGPSSISDRTTIAPAS